MPIVFDPNVFDISVFDASYTVPSLYKVTLEREFNQIYAGQAIQVTIYIATTITPGNKVLFNPDGNVTIAINKPNNTVQLASTIMVHKGVGIYTYNYQTSVNDVPGMYSARFEGNDGDKVMVSAFMCLYEILPT